MTGFDVAAGMLLLVSGILGLVRGATREVTTVVALVLAAVASMVALRVTGPIARRMIDTAWLANAAAILAVFILVYIVLRLGGGALTQSVRQTSLSGLDRILGFGIGLVRALVVLGAFTLLLNAATPPERMPAWISDARLYPLASAAGDSLRAFAPKGLKVAHKVAPDLADAVMGAPAAKRRRGPDDSYDPDRRRRDTDDPVEEPR